MTIMAEDRDNTLYRQAVLRLVEPGEGNCYRKSKLKTTLVCWLPSAKLKKKLLISLKNDPEHVWYVESIAIQETPRYLLHPDWHVGGL